MRLSFRAKTILGIAVIEVIFLSVLIINNLQVLTYSHETEFQKRADTLAKVFANAATDAVLSSDIATLNSLVEDLLKSAEVVSVNVTNGQQEIIVSGSDNLDRLDDSRVIYSVSNIEFSNTLFGSVLLGLDASNLDVVIAEARNRSIQIAIIEVALVAVASFLLGIYLTHHLSALRREIETTAQGNYEVTDYKAPNDEIGDTIKAFHELKTELKNSEDKKREILGRVGNLANEISQKETWLRTITNQLVDGIIAFDHRGTVHYCNTSAQQMLGYEEGRLEGLTVFDLTFTKAQQDRIRGFMEYGQSHQRRESINRHRNEVVYQLNGEPKSVSLSLSYSRIQNEDYFIMTLGEVSWRRHVEQQIILSESIKTGILESSLSAVVAIDSNDKILEFNPSAERMFGYAREHALGKPMVDLIVPVQYRAAHLKGMEHYRRTGEGPALGKRIQLTAIDNAGREFPIEMAITPIHAGDGDIFTAVIDDISERLEATRKLESAKIEADQANKEKSRFLASMSHEIRTPLNILLGMVELLQSTPLSDQQRQFSISAENASRSLLDMINDVLDFSKIEAGKMTPTITSFDPRPIFQETVLMFRQRVWSNGLRLFLFVDQSVPSVVSADQTFFRQIITNLMSNAVHYTKTGCIKARLVMKEVHGNKHLCAEIEDTGVGISEANISKIFNEFTQVHDKEDGSTGTGLGLVICREMANLIGGDIVVLSVEGTGSIFELQMLIEGSANTKETLPLIGKKVCLLSTSDDWIAEYCRQLEQWGATCLHGIDRTKLSTSDVVLIDLPKCSKEDLEEIDNLQFSLAKPKPAIALLEEDAHNISNLRLAYHVYQQPLAIEDLEAALLAALSSQKQEKTKRESFVKDKKNVDDNVTVEVSKGKVLLVEDSDVNRLIVKTFLEPERYEVVEAEDGQQAVDYLSHSSVDLVLMDMRMPILGGLEATRIIREQQLAEGVPIIALTAHALVEVRDECLRVGMQDFLTKPIDRQTLLRTIKQWIEPTTQSARALGKADHLDQRVITFSSDLMLFQRSAIEQLERDTSRNAVLSMLPIFEKEMIKRLDALEEFAEQKNLEQIEVSVHAMKSSAMIFGCIRLSECARQAEQSARGQDMDTTLNYCAMLKDLVAESLKAVHQEFTYEA